MMLRVKGITMKTAQDINARLLICLIMNPQKFRVRLSCLTQKDWISLSSNDFDAHVFF